MSPRGWLLGNGVVGLVGVVGRQVAAVDAGDAGDDLGHPDAQEHHDDDEADEGQLVAPQAPPRVGPQAKRLGRNGLVLGTDGQRRVELRFGERGG